MGGNELFEHGCFIKFLSYSCPLQQRIHGVMWQANGYLMSFGLCKPRKLSIKMDLRKKECNRWIKEMQRCNEWWLNRVATVSNRKSVIIFWICALYSIQFDRRSVFLFQRLSLHRFACDLFSDVSMSKPQNSVINIFW